MYEPKIFTEEEGRELLAIARGTLDKLVRHEQVSKPEKYPARFNEPHGVFCTLFKKGEVRGKAVVGLPFPLVSLVDGVVTATATASHENEKLAKIIPSELSDIKIELSILTEPKKVEAAGEKVLNHIISGTDGVMLMYGPYESFLPPQAWSAIHEKELFLEHLCMQAGLEKDAWRDSPINFLKFQVQVFRE